MALRGRAIRCQETGGDWERLYGTTLSGNLPQHKKHYHVGHCWAPCPYSTQCGTLRREHLIGAYGSPVDHTDAVSGKVHYMTTSSRGGWGYECTFDGCPYYTTYGRRYFYV